MPIDVMALERRAVEMAVAEARSDPRPSVPHEKVRAEIVERIERLRCDSKTLARLAGEGGE